MLVCPVSRFFLLLFVADCCLVCCVLLDVGVLVVVMCIVCCLLCVVCGVCWLLNAECTARRV